MIDRKGIIKHKAVFDAWLDGKVVQYYLDGKWWITGAPLFLEAMQYRVMPEPVTVRGYINVYPDGLIGCLLHPSDERAKLRAGMDAKQVLIKVQFNEE